MSVVGDDHPGLQNIQSSDGGGQRFGGHSTPEHATANDWIPLRSVGLHALKGDRRGQWAIAVNGPWRICFRFKGGDAYEVEIVDYH
jgi:RelE-like toxin of type II toxin-antitoxin system HigB